MTAVFRKILVELKLVTTTRPDEADAILVPPNGALLEAYRFPELLSERLKQLPDLPLTIFPSSAYFPHRDPSFIFKGRKSQTTWILREANSFDHLTELWAHQLAATNVSLALDHDVVASGHSLVPGLFPNFATKNELLISARVDREALPLLFSDSLPHTRSGLRKKVAVALSKLPSGSLLSAVMRFMQRGRQSAAARALLDRLPTRVAQDLSRNEGKQIECDISAVQFATYRAYQKRLAQSSIVVTNRLHVGLPAAILGKRVFLIEAGYHKLGGVYHRSLSNVENVTFINGAE
jgi:exopolysaccharide biosynthesis predicted pyruvyltransferase EpsI